MRNIFLGLLSLFSIAAAGQTLPPGECGLVYTYDAAGNRLKRVYFCNVSGSTYPTKAVEKDKAGLTEEIELVDALYPNPTTGRFTVQFSQPLKNAQVFVTDGTGKALQSFRSTGSRIEFNLSSMPNGVYYVRIENEGRVVTKKVVKR